MDMDLKSCFFTGHRPSSFKDYDEYSLVRARAAKFTEILIGKCIEQQIYNYVAGGALFYDTVAARAVLNYKFSMKDKPIHLTIAKPFPSQWIKWEAEDVDIYNFINHHANNVVNVSEDPYAVWKMHKRNEYMVNMSDFGIGLMKIGTDKGGTFECIMYARRKRKPMIIYDPLSNELHPWTSEELMELFGLPIEINIDESDCLKYGYYKF